MKSFSGNTGPGRKPKFFPGEVAWWAEQDTHVVVVDWKSDAEGRGSYRVIRLQSLYPHRRVGPAVWALSHKLSRIKGRPRAERSRSVYRANERIPERGCACQCCPHVAMELSDVGADGGFAWEEE